MRKSRAAVLAMRIGFIVSAWCPAITSPALAQPAVAGGGLPVFNFDAGITGWFSLDPGAKLEAVTDPRNIKEGAGALCVRYTPRKGALSAFGNPTVRIPGAKAATFHAKAEQPTVLSFILREKDDSRYQIVLACPAGRWNSYSVDFSELCMDDMSIDENAQLDVDQVDAVGFLDLEIVKAQFTEGPGTPRVVYVDEISFLATPTRTIEASRAEVDDFESGVGAWIPVKFLGGIDLSLDTEVGITTTGSPDNVKSGKRALRYHYRVTPGTTSVLLRQLGAGTMGKARALRFWVKTSAATPLYIVISERGGARYSTGLYSGKDQYQHITLYADGFRLEDNSRDANGQLDWPLVNSFQIADGSGFLAGLFKQNVDEERELFLDGFEALVTDTKPADAPAVAWSDTFRGNALHWMPIHVTIEPLAIRLFSEADFQITQAPERPEGNKALRFSYAVAAKTIAGLLRDIRQIAPDAARSLRLMVRTENDTTLVANLKERDESEYRHIFPLHKADGWKEVILPLSIFKLGEDRTDENGRLDLDQIKELALADVSFGVGNPGKNTLWIESVSLIR